MNISRLKISLAAALLLPALVAEAVPAKRDPFTVTQPDGTVLTVRLVGDERSHCYLSEDGYPLTLDNGTFYYRTVDTADGRLIRSEMPAQPVAKRSDEALKFLQGVDRNLVLETVYNRNAGHVRLRAPRQKAAAGPGLFSGTSFPSTGDQKALVILVEYSDVKFKIPNPLDYFSRMLNEEGFSDYGGTGSAADFFKENSNGAFRPDFDVYGPVTLANNMSYYGSNDAYGNDRRPEYMVIEACRALDEDVDFSQYDRDGDGLIDNVFVFYAGMGEASGGAANTVWPHSADIMSWDNTPYIHDGVRINRYACTNEWTGSRPDGVGTFIHEFSHVLGLPDLYATTYTSAFTPGSWSTLDYGPYNNNGCTPPLYSAFERYALGWMEPEVIDGACNVTLPAIGANQARIIRTGSDNEFFLLENRQQTGWDAYLPGHGMLVWHIDYKASVWDNNSVNNSPSHQYVDLEEADNIRNNYSLDGDAFPGSAKVTSFTDDTEPSMKTWKGVRLNLPVTDIKETDGIITFKVAGGEPAPAAVAALDATDVTPVSFTACWEPSAEAQIYRLSVYSGDGDDKATVGKFDNLNVGDVTSCTVDGLQPSTAYTYVVAVENAAGMSEPSNEISVTTSEMTFGFMRPEALSGIAGDDYIEARWNALDGADSYLISVYTKERKEPEMAVCDFTGGLSEMPQGWSTDARMTYSLTSYVGKATPSLRLNDNYVETPALPDDVHAVTFWYRGNNAPEENRLEISVFTESDGWTSHSVIPVVNDAGGRTVRVDNMPLGVRAVRISHDCPASGSVAIDDITVEWGGQFTTVAVDGFESLNVGNVLSYRVDGLQPAVPYYYTVTALQGELRSLPSLETGVVPGANLGVDSPDTGAALSVAVSGMTLTVTRRDGGIATVTDIAGRVVASSADVSFSALLPAAGVYIVRAGTAVSKVIVR